MSIYKDGKLIAGGRQCMPLLSFMWADHVLNDASWLRADTYSWQSGSVYQAAYQHLEDDIDGKTLQSETIAGITIQFYLADDGHKICPASEESNVSAIYNATGVAWYYIIDTANTRFKLPRDNTQNQRVLIKTITSGTKWARIYADGWVEQGDTNPGTFGTVNFLITMQDTNYNINFAPTDTYYVPRITDRTTSSFSSNGRNIDNSKLTGTTSFASWEVDGYADITNVASQFDAQYKYLYFYVGNFTQTALENTAGVTTEVLNDKLDLDLGNATSATKETIVGWGMPDYTAGVALSNLDTYQKFNEDGFLYFEGSGGGNWNAVGIFVSLDGSTEAFQFRISSAYGVINMFPIPKGIYIKRYNSNTTSMKFFPCKK